MDFVIKLIINVIFLVMNIEKNLKMLHNLFPNEFPVEAVNIN